ncbi:molybdopterin-guanine dinucleotide biosynthesis protein B [Halomonas sp. PAMB 3264]|uniref:molybdopterin-guanine dinucleotide biosynthesis protein B n=1 Tax=Halomonas sp. PAMB 3264 TaxID=3075222 RepID=UPI00289B62B6|nr:molybdopterin-guanine dinucleotide biosynthesis protein B [Halomonas sp. PAMB 3264]WNL40851.1 molybdopterin-guanine dinucleotide biosynthesis protein B [Halomonas sp. PAMB 3264]
MLLQPISAPFPVLGVAAWSGTGKTTLLTELLPRLKKAGLNVGVIKHAHHAFDIDKPGKDSYRLREAGAAPMLVASNQRYALMQETPAQRQAGQEGPDLLHLLSLMAAHRPDLVIVEGFKTWPLSKLVLYRDGIGDESIIQSDNVVAVALKGEAPERLDASIPQLNLDNIDEIARWVLEWTRAHRDESTQ